MTRATYRELFPDDEEDPASGDDRHSITLPWSHSHYKQNRLAGAADAAQTPSGSALSAIPTRPRTTEPRIGTPCRRSATRHSTPLDSQREEDLRAFLPFKPVASRAASPLPALHDPQAHAHRTRAQDNAPESGSVPTRSQQPSPQGHHSPAPAQRCETMDAPGDRQAVDQPQHTNTQPHLSDQDLDEILKALSSEGGPLFDLDSSISFSRQEDNIPWSTVTAHPGFERQPAMHTSTQQGLAQKPATPYHHLQGYGGSRSSVPPVAKPADDPLAMLIQLTRNMQHMSNQVNNLSAANERLGQENARLRGDAQRLESELTEATERAEYARQSKKDSIDNAKRCLQNIKQQYQGLESTLASQKSMHDSSRAKNLALISQLCGARDDLKKQVAECKSALSQALEVKTSNARQTMETLKECQAYARSLEIELQAERRQHQQLEFVQQALQASFGDMSQTILTHLVSLPRNGANERDDSDQSEQILAELRAANTKVEERSSQLASLQKELQETRADLLAQNQKCQALSSARDQAIVQLNEQGRASSQLTKAKDDEIKRLRAEVDQLQRELSDAHRNEMTNKEGVTVASMELLTLKRSLEAKSKEIESLSARLKEQAESHTEEVEDLKRQVQQATQQERVAAALAQERKVYLDKMKGSIPTERASSSSRVRRLMPFQRPPTPPHPRTEQHSVTDQPPADGSSSRSRISERSKLSTPPEPPESSTKVMRDKRKSWEAETLLDGIDPASIFGASSEEEPTPPAAKSAKKLDSFRVRATITSNAKPQPASELVPASASASRTRPRRKTRKTE